MTVRTFAPTEGDVFSSPVRGEVVEALRVDWETVLEDGWIVPLFRVLVQAVEGNAEPRWITFRNLVLEDGKAFARAI